MFHGLVLRNIRDNESNMMLSYNSLPKEELTRILTDVAEGIAPKVERFRRRRKS